MQKSLEHPPEPERSDGVSETDGVSEWSQKPINSITSKFFQWEDSSDGEGDVWNDELEWKTSPCKIDEAASVEWASWQNGDDTEEGASNVDEPCTVRPCSILNDVEGARAERARHRMEYATGSQWAILEEELDEIEKGEGDGSMLVQERVLVWRKERGDFKHYSENQEDDDDEENAYLGDVDVPQLPSDMSDVNEAVLRLCFLKSDLQFECLLRSIPYEATDAKTQLISRLMEYKDTVSRKAINSFQALQEQCDASTCNPSEHQPEFEQSDGVSEWNQKPISSITSKLYRWQEERGDGEGDKWNDELEWKTSPCKVDETASVLEWWASWQNGDDEVGGAWNDETCTVRPGSILNDIEGARAERARHRMEYATGPQWAILEEQLDGIEEGEGGGCMPVQERVLAWRKDRGDFKYDSENEEDDDDEGNAYLGDVDVPQLPSDMSDVNEAMLRSWFLKSDLQFECLLRNIPYKATDAKLELVSKLMEHKDTVSRRAINTFQAQLQCDASTCNPSPSESMMQAGERDDAGGTHPCRSAE